MSLVYLAHPIDQAGVGEWHRLVDYAASKFRFESCVVYQPAQAFLVGTGTPVDPRLDGINREALMRCDAVLAFVPAGVPTIGVPREVEVAIQYGTPVHVVTNLTHAWSLADLDLYPMTAEGVDAAVGAVLTAPDRSDEFATMALSFLNEGEGQLPSRTYSGDAGLDLYVSERTVVPVGQFRDVPCSIRVALPPGVWGRITGRSSTLRKRGLLVAEGIIDSGYRGPLYSGVHNLGGQAVVVEKGERIAQLILQPNVTAVYRPAWASVAEFAGTPGDGRGALGFGSTGG